MCLQADHLHEEALGGNKDVVEGGGLIKQKITCHVTTSPNNLKEMYKKTCLS